jgi:hypothetical protein
MGISSLMIVVPVYGVYLTTRRWEKKEEEPQKTVKLC